MQTSQAFCQASEDQDLHHIYKHQQPVENWLTRISSNNGNKNDIFLWYIMVLTVSNINKQYKSVVYSLTNNTRMAMRAAAPVATVASQRITWCSLRLEGSRTKCNYGNNEG